TAAMPDGTGLTNFAKQYPERFFDVGIAEQHGATFAAGLACEGKKPVFAVYSTFLQRAYDQVLHDVCIQNLPVVFALDRGGVVGNDGPTHHGVFDLSYLRHIPNMTLMAPKDENELRQMIYSAFQYGHPVAIRFPKGKGIGVKVDPNFSFLPAGQAELLKPGQDLIIAYGYPVNTALEVANRLEEKGLSLAVINARFARPLDEELIISQAQKARTIFTLEEGILEGGFGTAVRELLDRQGLYQVRFKSFGLTSALYPVGKAEEIRKLLRLDADSLVEDISRFYSS
ncbi:MAG TPA: 1-deoxy-D-xylulose-5-phosphate synthase, partial [Acidobacteria bacterium]|nr:1-deoxy-D-xylulose-5-phosphate synthase [Acidobacteriota bacterium]